MVENKTILITGGAGFIGSHLACALSPHNKVIVLDNLTTGSKENIADLSVDLREGDTNQVDMLVPEKVDFILHLGIASSTTLYLNDKSLVGSQINGSIKVFEKAVKDGSKVVVASSSSLYNQGKYPSVEEQEIQITDFYTECRLAIERLAKLYSDLYAMKAVCLRMFSVYGGKRELGKGPFMNMVIKFILKIKEGKNPVSYDIRPKQVERDFIYIDDVVRAWLLAMEYQKENFNIFNVGSGKKYSFLQLVQIINQVTGKNAQLEYEKNPLPNLVFQNWANTQKAEKELGFQALVSLEQGIRNVWEFLNQQ
jgi:UDP-glucose 4-epimerase